MSDQEGTPEPLEKVRPSAGSMLRRHAIPLLAVLGLAAAAAVRFNRALTAGFSSGDEVSPDEVQRRVAAFATMAPVPLRLVPPEEREQAITALGLTPDQGQSLAAAVRDDRVRLAYLTLYDSDVEDGDAVTVNSTGFSVSLVLTKAPKTIAVPVPQSGTVDLVGIIDGKGGGVTVGVVTPAGAVPLPPMSVGQVIHLPVSAP